jgi:SOS-response transcriptional repressor LexA
MPDPQDARETPDFLARIGERLDALGLAERAASLRAFGHPKGLHNLRVARSPSLDAFARLAPVLETTPAWLAYGIGDAAIPPARRAEPGLLPIVGEVAAGLWLEVDTVVDAPTHDAVPLAADPRWPPEEQFAVVVRGTSINRVAPDGAVLACIALPALRREVREGELVIVERRRHGGHDLERTAKRLRRVAGGYELWPDTTDPRHKPIRIAGDAEPDDGISITVIALVVRTLQPIPPDTPWSR